jgi:preprotein translocase subunit SecG
MEWSHIFWWVFVILFIFVSMVMILLVLVQKGRGGGLSSAFGGGGGNTAFGSKTGDVLTWATSIVFALFVILAVALNLIGDRVGARTPAAGQSQQIPGPAGSPGAPELPNPGK